MAIITDRSAGKLSKQHAKRSNLIRQNLNLAAVALAVVATWTFGLLYSAAFTLLPSRLQRRDLILSLGTGTVLCSPNTALAKEKWRTDIPRVLAALQDLQKEFPKFMADGMKTEGANKIRSVMVKQYADRVTVTIPTDKNLQGALSRTGVITSSADKSLGWLEGDTLVSASGVVYDGGDIDLTFVQKKAKDDGKPLQLVLSRDGPPLFVDFEKQLQEAYVAIGDESLGDLEEIQKSVGYTEMLAASAASATQVSEDTMKNLGASIDKLVEELKPFAKAIAA